jgi:hypothetical protein
MSDNFQIIVERARERVGEKAWEGMSVHERADAIYREMRAMDAEKIARSPSWHGDGAP